MASRSGQGDPGGVSACSMISYNAKSRHRRRTHDLPPHGVTTNGTATTRALVRKAGPVESRRRDGTSSGIRDGEGGGPARRRARHPDLARESDPTASFPNGSDGLRGDPKGILKPRRGGRLKPGAKAPGPRDLR